MFRTEKISKQQPQTIKYEQNKECNCEKDINIESSNNNHIDKKQGTNHETHCA